MWYYAHMGKTKALGVLAISIGMMLVGFIAPLHSGAAVPNTNPNHPDYWEQVLADQGITAECYDHPGTVGQYGHGDVRRDRNGKTYVILNEFNQDWFGDHWALLVVKGGSSGGDGNGNAVYYNPDDEVPYYAPLNSGGQQADVSHWIVCKGETPVTTTSTSSTSTSTSTSTSSTSTSTSTSTSSTSTSTSTVPETTTTVPEITTTSTTSTTVPETTTTTVPETTTTTVSETTSSTVPETTTTSIVGDTTPTTAPGPTTTVGLTPQPDSPPALARTGSDTSIAAVGAALILLGVVALGWNKTRRYL